MYAQAAPSARSGLGCEAEGVLMSTDTTTAPAQPTLQHFTLDDLAVYTAEQAFGPTASPDFRVF